MHTITLKMRYRKGGRQRIISIEMEEDHATPQELAELFAKKSAKMYNSYCKGKLDKKALQRYEFGHYKLFLHYLETLT